MLLQVVEVIQHPHQAFLKRGYRPPAKHGLCLADVEDVDRYVTGPGRQTAAGNIPPQQFTDQLNQVIQAVAYTAADVEYPFRPGIAHGSHDGGNHITDVQIIPDYRTVAPDFKGLIVQRLVEKYRNDSLAGMKLLIFTVGVGQP